MIAQVFVWCRIGWIHYPYLFKDASIIIFCCLPCHFVSQILDCDHPQNSMFATAEPSILLFVGRAQDLSFLSALTLYTSSKLGRMGSR